MNDPIIPQDSQSAQVNNSSDWRTIDTHTPDGCAALDQFIARRLGFKGHCVNCCWATDVDEALELIDDLPKHWVFILIHHTDRLWKATIHPSKAKTGGYWEQSWTPALAICRVWLAYTDAESTVQS